MENKVSFKILKYSSKSLLLTILICLISFLYSFGDKAKEFYDEAKRYQNQGKYQQAIVSFKKAINLQPHYPSAYHNMAHAYEEIGDFDQALESFNLAISLNPSDPKHFYCRGRLYYYKKRMYQEAIEDFKSAIRLKSDYVWAYHILAHVYEVINEYDKAIFCLTKAVEIEPSVKAHRDCLEKCKEKVESISTSLPQEIEKSKKPEKKTVKEPSRFDKLDKHKDEKPSFHRDESKSTDVKKAKTFERIVSYMEKQPPIRFIIIIAAIFTIVGFIILLRRGR